MCAFHLMHSPSYLQICTPFVSFFFHIANEQKKVFTIFLMVSFSIYSDWKIEHSNSCNSKKYMCCCRCRFCFFVVVLTSIICIVVVLHVSFMTALFEKCCCCSHTKNGFKSVVLFSLVLFRFFCISKLENLTHPISFLSPSLSPRFVRSKKQNIYTISIELANTILDMHGLLAIEVCMCSRRRRRHRRVFLKCET